MHPCILAQFDLFAQSVQGKRLAIFLDYDGTLTPIVKNPDEAFMSEQMRSIVQRLAQRYPTAIISGRGREKLEQFVQLRELYYAGSHGMDIVGPDVHPSEAAEPSTPGRDGTSQNGDVDMEPSTCSNGHAGSDASQNRFTFQAAAAFRPLIDDAFRELTCALETIPGASVEHNIFCISAHFRNCAQEHWASVAAAVESIAASRPQLRVTRGRKVLELRPKIDWDKGRALLEVLNALGLQSQSDVVSLYIGDDLTDEDAFKALNDNDLGACWVAYPPLHRQRLVADYLLLRTVWGTLYCFCWR